MLWKLDVMILDALIVDTHSVLDAAVLDATVLDGTILDVVNTPYEGDFGCFLEVMNVGCCSFGCCVNWMLRSWMLQYSPAPIEVAASHGRCHGFLSGGGRSSAGWPTYPQNTLKIGKNTGFWPLHSRIWGGRNIRF